MIVNSRPFPKIRNLFQNTEKSSQSVQVFNKNVRFFDLGRNALLFGLIKLGLKPGDKIVVPAYICNSTIEPAISYGITPIFIDVNEHLYYDFDQLKSVIISDTRIKVVLFIEYFGYAFDFKKFINLCNENRIYSILDVSHSFLTHINLKREYEADATIYSLRKTLPVLDGGALELNSRFDSTDKEFIKSSSFISDVNYLIGRCIEKFLLFININIYSDIFTNFKKRLRSSRKMINKLVTPVCSNPSRLLKSFIHDDLFIREIENQIKLNFKCIDNLLYSSKVNSFFKEYKFDIYPQCYVLFDKSGGLANHLREQGVGAWNWPDDEIPKAVLDNKDIWKLLFFSDVVSQSFFK